MKDNHNNFVRWFEEPLSNLYKNPHAGFAIVILSLPILERYLREKSGVCEKPNLDARFHQEFLNMSPPLTICQRRGNFGRYIAMGFYTKPL